MCCGQKREALKSASTTVKKKTGSAMALRYISNSPTAMRGPVTGIPYEFSRARRIQAVDPRDAAILMRTGLFRET